MFIFECLTNAFSIFHGEAFFAVALVATLVVRTCSSTTWVFNTSTLVHVNTCVSIGVQVISLWTFADIRTVGIQAFSVDTAIFNKSTFINITWVSVWSLCMTTSFWTQFCEFFGAFHWASIAGSIEQPAGFFIALTAAM